MNLRISSTGCSPHVDFEYSVCKNTWILSGFERISYKYPFLSNEGPKSNYKKVFRSFKNTHFSVKIEGHFSNENGPQKRCRCSFFLFRLFEPRWESFKRKKYPFLFGHIAIRIYFIFMLQSPPCLLRLRQPHSVFPGLSTITWERSTWSDLHALDAAHPYCTDIHHLSVPQSQ